MNEKRLSELQRDYRSFFIGKMDLYGVKSPAHLTKDEKSKFFTELKLGWAVHKQSKVPSVETEEKIENILLEPAVEFKTGDKFENSIVQTDPKGRNRVESSPESKTQSGTGHHSKQVIKSVPNPEQHDELRILYEPNCEFEQQGQYQYPVVMMPKANARLKLPRSGRSNQKGYKEDDFYNHLKLNLHDVEVVNDVHLVIPNFGKPYEPDIVLCNKALNLYIDIEIDEPYDGYFRYPTHCINPEDRSKQDYIRDLFFIESGWLVIRFTEKQIHCQVDDCLAYIRNVLNSIYHLPYTSKVRCETEEQWDYNDCIQWQKHHYREKYLGIHRFQKQRSHKEVVIDTQEQESIEQLIERTKQFNSVKWDSNISFDEETHKYLRANDQTGNAEYIAVTTLIERFFPFDLKRYIEKKAEEEGREEQDVLKEYQVLRDEAAEKGTYLHKQIENFLRKKEFDSDFKEFDLFLQFYDSEIKPRNISFYDAERVIYSEKYHVAGTIDCLFKKGNTDEYVMLDWKRSKKLIIDGNPRIFGYGYALSDLCALDNSSYNRYCLQQNIYKYIAEKEYSLRISSMGLVVLHENYPEYYIVPVPIMENETLIILNSLKLKI